MTTSRVNTLLLGHMFAGCTSVYSFFPTGKHTHHSYVPSHVRFVPLNPLGAPNLQLVTFWLSI